MKEKKQGIPEGQKNEREDKRALLLLERKKAIYNLILLLAASFVVLIGAITMAWFSDNEKVNGTNMSVKIKGPNYVITMLENGGNGLYYDIFHHLVQGENAVILQMDNEFNMENVTPAPTGQIAGIHPGSCGKISFYVTPKINEVHLDYEFEILGYVDSKDEVTNEIGMTRLDQDSDPAIFLNGHILLFGSRTGTSSENYVYSDPILSGEDMKRVLENQQYSGINHREQVYIYWVWPQTLSKIVDARGCTKITVTEAPFMDTSGDDYTKLVSNLTTYPDYYLKFEETENAGNTITASDIVTNYDLYGDYYDQADNDIGMAINYILLKMSVSESASGNSGSGGGGSGE